MEKFATTPSTFFQLYFNKKYATKGRFEFSMNANIQKP
jgi:hypothetical protein